MCVCERVYVKVMNDCYAKTKRKKIIDLISTIVIFFLSKVYKLQFKYVENREKWN